MMTSTEGLKIRDSPVTPTLRHTSGNTQNTRVLMVRAQKCKRHLLYTPRQNSLSLRPYKRKKHIPEKRCFFLDTS
jgi:hypothetical protein